MNVKGATFIWSGFALDHQAPEVSRDLLAQHCSLSLGHPDA
ncbi:MAG: hypothetical protein V7772_11490 [Pseudomonas profundi]